MTPKELFFRIGTVATAAGLLISATKQADASIDTSGDQSGTSLTTKIPLARRLVQPSLTKKLTFKRTSSGKLKLVAHASHSSHYSHQSGSGDSGTYTPPVTPPPDNTTPPDSGGGTQATPPTPIWTVHRKMPAKTAALPNNAPASAPAESPDRDAMVTDFFGHVQNNEIGPVRHMISSSPWLVSATDGGGNTALHIAAENARPEIAQMLIDNGADVNAVAIDGKAPIDDLNISFTSSDQSVKLLNLLLTKGADPNGESTTPPIVRIASSINPLADPFNDLSIINDSDQMIAIRALMKQGADIEPYDDNNNTLLLYCTAHNLLGLAKVLVTAGANVRAANSLGDNPLHILAKNGSTNFQPLVDLLIAKQININAEDSSGSTPLDLAIQNGHQDLAEYLRQKGGKE